MNQATIEALGQVLRIAQDHLAEGDDCAIALVDEDAAFVGDFWGNEAAFVEAVEARVSEVRSRLIFALPIVIRTDDPTVYRQPNDELDDDESEQLHVLTCDLSTGLDLLRIPIVRGGEVIVDVDNAEIYEGLFRLLPHTPGMQLVSSLITGGNG